MAIIGLCQANANRDEQRVGPFIFSSSEVWIGGTEVLCVSEPLFVCLLFSFRRGWHVSLLRVVAERLALRISVL